MKWIWYANLMLNLSIWQSLKERKLNFIQVPFEKSLSSDKYSVHVPRIVHFISRPCHPNIQDYMLIVTVRVAEHEWVKIDNKQVRQTQLTDMIAPLLTFALQAATYQAGIPTHNYDNKQK